MKKLQTTNYKLQTNKDFTSLNPAKRARSNLTGFTLVEILIVIAIMVVFTSVVVFRHRDFSNSIELKNTAYDIALALRETQVFGISSRGTDTVESFFYGYGVNFSTATPDSYISFVDSAGDNNLWFDDVTEELKKIDFPNGYKINELCFTPASSGIEDCAPPTLNVLFRRPEVDAIIKTTETGDSATSARIEIISPSGKVANVRVYESGQISVE
ncbi:prepilin-type N-terminal cleavage/methylation domain-containing protein [Patescibacteria group bacterium]|nr:prepilin-type N-terminal cleavage/methylation domain-containing protein [Patescibacteria group bacterium]MBU1246633.1 prepilin-type N-terminal cleavage/methylation domain-containing protein [Patescibacteria group bacterium]MBU1519683.1 prepilin-type N-terminal cleavage/methylation domain-containing protein [Patescibacteria group bacterium]MBU1730110.1 prepilin-type N-terminal cleavage/methylation domain-containing protein [Patescibacteria group bacterium]MBU1956622.1 prepilin-type N-terminal